MFLAWEIDVWNIVFLTDAWDVCDDVHWRNISAEDAKSLFVLLQALGSILDAINKLLLLCALGDKVADLLSKAVSGEWGGDWNQWYGLRVMPAHMRMKDLADRVYRYRLLIGRISFTQFSSSRTTRGA